MKTTEANHAEAVNFLEVCQRNGVNFWAPATVMWEIMAARTHPGKRGTEADYAGAVGKYSAESIPVDNDLFKKTWDPKLAPIKAADRIWISCAKKTGFPLITFDGPLATQAPAFGVEVFRPAAFLAAKNLH